MTPADVEYRETKDIDPDTLQHFFRQEQWNDFLDLDEVEHYLRSAVYVVTAWLNDELIGYANLVGDGRTWVEISDVVVKCDCQGRGIATEMVRRMMEHIKELNPYFINVSPIGDREAHLYSKFGFAEVPYRMMEIKTEKLSRKVAQVRRKDEPEA